MIETTISIMSVNVDALMTKIIKGCGRALGTGVDSVPETNSEFLSITSSTLSSSDDSSDVTIELCTKLLTDVLVLCLMSGAMTASRSLLDP